MTKKDILTDLKEIQDRTFALCLKKNVITLEEFEDLTDRLYRKICRLKKEIEEGIEK